MTQCPKCHMCCFQWNNCFTLTYTQPACFFSHSHLYCTNPSDVFYIRVPLFTLSLSRLSASAFPSSRFLHFSGGGGRSTTALHHRCEGGRIGLRKRFITLHLFQINSLQKPSICLSEPMSRKKESGLHWAIFQFVSYVFKTQHFSHIKVKTCHGISLEMH